MKRIFTVPTAVRSCAIGMQAEPARPAPPGSSLKQRGGSREGPLHCYCILKNTLLLFAFALNDVLRGTFERFLHVGVGTATGATTSTQFRGEIYHWALRDSRSLHPHLRNLVHQAEEAETVQHRWLRRGEEVEADRPRVAYGQKVHEGAPVTSS